MYNLISDRSVLPALVPYSLGFSHAHWYYRPNIMSTLYSALNIRNKVKQAKLKSVLVMLFQLSYSF